MKIALLTTPVFHDATEVSRNINGQMVKGQDKVIYGGAERVLYDLCMLLQECGNSVTIFQPFHGIPKAFTKMFKGFPVVCLPINGGWEYQTNTDLNWQFNEHASLFDMRIYFGPFLSFPNVVSPCIMVSHGIYWDNIEGANVTRTLNDEQKKEFFKRQLYGFMAADAVVSVDSNTRKVIQAMEPGYEKRIHIIYNYVDCQKFFPVEKKTWDGINVLYPRRLTTMRGSTEITKAFINLPQYNFTLAGQAWDTNAAKAFADSHKHRGNVNFLHREMDDMPPIYRQADISVVPTKSCEGTSLSFLESAASGLPIITTPVGGLGDLCIDGYNALIYDPNHEDICDYIQALAKDKETRIKFGKRSREIACECFDIEIWKYKWRNLLAQFGVVPEKQYAFKTQGEIAGDALRKVLSDLDTKRFDEAVKNIKELINNLDSSEYRKALETNKDNYSNVYNGLPSKAPKPKLVAMMLTHNEADRYLERVIENTLLFCDEIVILDDHSDDYDKLQELAEKIDPIIGTLKGEGAKIFIAQSENSWENENLLRQELLTWALEHHPDWLIAIDADELYEASRMNEQLPYLMAQTEADWIGFRFYDMWDEEHYRDDDIWPAGTAYMPRMFRVKQSGTEYKWFNARRHCGSIPVNVLRAAGINSSVRVKHLGWMKQKDRDKKYLNRVTDDPKNEFFPQAVYDAILDDHPTLVKWDDNNPWQTSKLTIAYPPGMEWNIMQQRPHHLLKLAASERNRVFFGDDSASGVYEALPYLTVVNGETFDYHNEVDVLYVTSPAQMERRKKIKYKKLIYDCCDWMGGADDEILGKADYVLCASRLLYDYMIQYLGSYKCTQTRIKNNIIEQKILYLPNACDFDHFSRTGEAGTILGEKLPEPVIAYMGCIHPAMVDEAIINKIAEKHKLLMIGQNKGMKLNNPNIYAMGHVKYQDLPRVLSAANVGIIPFRTDSDYLRYSAPIKVYEYLAGGRPVVASPIPELMSLAEQGLIRIVANDDLEGWIKAIEEAIQEYPNIKGIEYAKTQTWKHIWETLKKEVFLK